MLILGIILIIAGALLGIPILYTIGIILAVVGAILLIWEAVTRRPVGGRRYY